MSSRPPVVLAAVAAIASAVAAAAAATAPVKVRPGSLVRWPGDAVTGCAIGERRFAAMPDGCVFAVDLLHPAGPLLLTRWRAGRRETASVRVGHFDYPTQTLTLPKEMVEPSPADAERIRRENQEIARLWDREGERRFTLPLQAPLDPLPQGGRFGSRRVINGLLRSPHGGSDYSAALGTPVLAAADGVVALVGDHFFGGRSLFLDHGDGLITMYFHLSAIGVKEGDAVRRGEPIGAVGSSGRATGPHLHFGVRWHGARVDPRWLLLDPLSLPFVPAAAGW